MKLPRFVLNRFALDRTRRLVESPQELLRVVEEASLKTDNASSSSRLKGVLAELKVMLDLLKAVGAGKYKISKADLLLIAGAVVYFLMPVDAIPDVILGAGFVDDAMVLAFVINSAQEILADFRRSSDSMNPETEE